MKGERREAAWTPTADSEGAARGAPDNKGPRWTMSLRALVVLLAMAVAVVGVLWMEQAGTTTAASQLATQEPAKVTVPPLDAKTTAGASLPAKATAGASTSTRKPSGATASGDGVVVVHVVGAVKRPGVYILRAGSRIQQAVEAAGGAQPDAVLDALNLAALAVDGTQISVPTRAQVDAGTGGGTAGQGAAEQPSAGSPGGLLNINTATVEELDALPGVGPVLAGRILAWRTGHGPFKSVDELDAVSGIGAKMLANIRPLVTVQ